VALQVFVRALPLATLPLEPAVLDALGQHYSLTHSYTAALHYHLRACRTWASGYIRGAEPITLYRRAIAARTIVSSETMRRRAQCMSRHVGGYAQNTK
jgi:hypothetical protein